MSDGSRFTKDSAAAAGRKSGESRRRQAAVSRQARKALDVLVQENPEHFTSDLESLARAGASRLLAQVALGDVPHRYVHHVAHAARTLYEIARLEQGLPTRYQASVNAVEVRHIIDEARKAASSISDTPDP